MRKFLIMLAAFPVLAPLNAMSQEPQNDAAMVYKVGAIKWPFRVLVRAEKLFKKRQTSIAPDSTLHFKLPPQVENSDKNPLTVRLIQEDGDSDIPIAVGEQGIFALPQPTDQAWDSASLVVNGSFTKGSHYPEPVVRSSHLAPNEMRVGDVRLSCEVRVELARAVKTGVDIMMGIAKALSLNPCTEKKGYRVHAPVPFNKVTYLAGDRIVASTTFTTPRQSIAIDTGRNDLANDTIVRFEQGQ